MSNPTPVVPTPAADAAKAAAVEAARRAEAVRQNPSRFRRSAGVVATRPGRR